MNEPDLALGLIWYIVFLFSTTCHEAAHALAAKLGGDLTAFHGGQVSLDPTPHIRREPFGMVFFPILSFFMGGWMMGWASAPYDPTWAYRYPRRAAWMSLAGPAANFTLAILAGVLIHAGIAFGMFRVPDQVRFTQVVLPTGDGLSEALVTLLSLMFSLNILLGAFNLIPIPPLDGFAVAGLLMTENVARKWENLGTRIRAFSFVGILISWQVFGYMASPIWFAALQALYFGR